MNIVKTVRLKNFRSHEEFLLDCNKPTTLIIGENGSGKTSILEAVYLALRGRSFKGVDTEMVRRGEEYYRVELVKGDGSSVVVRWNGAREFEVDGKKTRRLPKKSKYPVILFEPDDLYLVGSAPSRRRDYFDKLLAQLNEEYGLALGKYNKALKQRNDVLKNESVTRDDVFSWGVMLAKYGAALSVWRDEFVEKINQRLTDVYRDIARNEDAIGIKFVFKERNESKYLAELNRTFERDRYVGHTTFGAHLDDYVFWFNDEKADGSASRGEVRSMILALKFIEAKIIREETNKDPLVLLDDIFSELDERRQKHLINNFKSYQVIISGTSVPKEMGVGIKL
ncbi:DNA replication and repair protein RecF [Candidatus Saccharibacteria bacterium]|nr:DNA replication and repair protein RecF [Candidatus Saccharibacteria bacterium]